MKEKWTNEKEQQLTLLKRRCIQIQCKTLSEGQRVSGSGCLTIWTHTHTHVNSTFKRLYFSHAHLNNDNRDIHPICLKLINKGLGH